MNLKAVITIRETTSKVLRASWDFDHIRSECERTLLERCRSYGGDYVPEPMRELHAETIKKYREAFEDYMRVLEETCGNPDE